MARPRLDDEERRARTVSVNLRRALHDGGFGAHARMLSR